MAATKTRNRRKSKGKGPLAQDLREAIRQQLRDIDRTPWWVSMRQRVVHPASCRDYLRGNRDTTGAVIAELMRIVGLKVVGGPIPPEYK
jgi:hypothetical protein